MAWIFSLLLKPSRNTLITTLPFALMSRLMWMLIPHCHCCYHLSSFNHDWPFIYFIFVMYIGGQWHCPSCLSIRRENGPYLKKITWHCRARNKRSGAGDDDVLNDTEKIRKVSLTPTQTLKLLLPECLRLGEQIRSSLMNYWCHKGASMYLFYMKKDHEINWVLLHKKYGTNLVLFFCIIVLNQSPIFAHQSTFLSNIFLRGTASLLP